MHTNFLRTTLVFIALLTLTSGVSPVTATPPATHSTLSIDDNTCDVTFTPDRITWHPQFSYVSATLVVAGPGNSPTSETFEAGDDIALDITQTQLEDDLYRYELRFAPELTREAEAALTALRDAPDRQTPAVEETLADLLPEPLPVFSGSFTIIDGHLLSSSTPEEPSLGVTQGAEAIGDGTTYLPQAIAPLDVVYNDDLIVEGSLCTGFDCVDEEAFGFDTIRLKENNLRIHFQDTSATASFPTVDWAIVANDSASGGADKFAIEQRDAARTPFTIMANARNNAIFVDGNRVGFGTSTPGTTLEMLHGDTPTIRLNQDGSSGWAAQVWDIAGNESNLFIRDVTGGSHLPVRLGPGLPTDSLTVRYADGRVGLGTWQPQAKLHLTGVTDTTYLKVENTSAEIDARTLMHLSNLGTSEVVVENRALGSIWTAAYTGTYTMVYSDTSLSSPVQAMELDKAGNMVLRGALVESSDVALKENFTPVDNAAILAALADLEIQTWNYIADDDTVQHIGPTAQNFHAAFGLGFDNKHISPLDANGVTMAAVQALVDRVNTQAEDIDAQTVRIAELEQENADLAQRLAILETLVNELLAED